MKKEFKSKNEKEYLFLREEMMYRMSMHNDCSKRATAMFVYVFSGCIGIIAYLTKEFSNEDMGLFGIPRLAFVLASILMLMLILFFFLLSLRIRRSWFDVCKISTYLTRFHEKPIDQNEDGLSFSWETAGKDFNNHLGKKIYYFRELHLVSCFSLVSFLFFLWLALWGLFDSPIIEITSFFSVMTLVIWIIEKIFVITTNIYTSKFREDIGKSWENLPNDSTPHTQGQ